MTVGELRGQERWKATTSQCTGAAPFSSTCERLLGCPAPVTMHGDDITKPHSEEAAAKSGFHPLCYQQYTKSKDKDTRFSKLLNINLAASQEKMLWELFNKNF